MTEKYPSGIEPMFLGYNKALQMPNVDELKAFLTKDNEVMRTVEWALTDGMRLMKDAKSSFDDIPEFLIMHDDELLIDGKLFNWHIRILDLHPGTEDPHPVVFEMWMMDMNEISQKRWGLFCHEKAVDWLLGLMPHHNEMDQHQSGISERAEGLMSEERLRFVIEEDNDGGSVIVDYPDGLFDAEESETLPTIDDLRNAFCTQWDVLKRILDFTDEDPPSISIAEGLAKGVAYESVDLVGMPFRASDSRRKIHWRLLKVKGGAFVFTLRGEHYKKTWSLECGPKGIQWLKRFVEIEKEQRM